MPTILYIFLYGEPYGPALKAASYLTGTSVMALVLLFLVRREIRGSQVVLTDEGIIRKSPYKVITVGYEAFTSVTYKKVPGIRGYLRIGAEGGTLRIPLLMENASGLIGDLVRVLDNVNNRCMKPADADRLRIEARRADEAHGRARKATGPLACALLTTVFFNLYVSVYHWDLMMSSVIAWGLIGFFFPLFAFYLAEHRYISETGLSGNTSRKKPDYLFYGFITFIIYCISGILFRNFFA